MQFDEIPESRRYEYKGVCECCEKEHTIWTLRDDFPEYVTEIYIQCECGEYIEFTLPVSRNEKK